MAIYTSTSRYRLVQGGMLANRVTQEPVPYTQYVSRDGDTFERISARMFNDGTRYWEIADINPQVQYPDTIPTGTVLRLPR